MLPAIAVVDDQVTVTYIFQLEYATVPASVAKIARPSPMLISFCFPASVSCAHGRIEVAEKSSEKD